MESQPDLSPLIVIVGETASGKSALAMEVAKHWNSEIIAADSRTIYKGMGIATAKPSKEDIKAVPHHLIDVITPDQSFSAAEFQRLANEAIVAIASRGRLPIMVGGTGLYIDALLYNFSFNSKVDTALREEQQGKSVEELQALLLKLDIPLPANAKNPRHLIRALETEGAPVGKEPLRPNTLVIGISVEREVLRNNICNRVDAMVAGGLIEEIKRVTNRHGWDAPGLSAPGYKAFRKYFTHEISLEEAKQLFVRGDMQLAKRQRTWFKRNKSIHWISKKEEAVDLITTFLNK